MDKKEELRRERMARNRKSFIFITILCMGIGFALLSSNLTITGNTNVSGNSWKVYFNSVSVTNGSVEASVVPEVSGTTTTSLDYTILLDKPGDFYEFTVEAKNDGTIDAAIDTLTTPNISSRVLQYLNYSVKYLDGSDVQISDVLKAKTSTTYKIRIEYRTDIEASDLDAEGVNLDLTFGVNYAQSDIKDSNFAKLVKSNALSDSNIDFSNISSASNGRGLYVLSGTQNRAYPVYYYRGAVTNNNAKFAGFCWKIVRTTETGGTKLIYNGLPDGNGECNATGSATQLNTSSAFNNFDESIASGGYMYGTVYENHYQYPSTSTTGIYGNSFTYENGNYTLSDSQIGLDSTHHYTCFNSTGICSDISYVFLERDSYAYYITLSNGSSIEDAIDEMNTNSNDSTIKSVIDNWFNNTFKTYFTSNSKDYNDYLEDTIWCNDRSWNTIEVTLNSWEGSSAINNGWNPNGGVLSNYFWQDTYGRWKTGAPKITCSNKNDSFTVTETVKGNGALIYPVGLLTVDEVMLAGGTKDSYSDYYLSTNAGWWTMSPSHFATITYFYGFVANSIGGMDSLNIYDERGVRPSISLKPEVKIASGGDGTSAHPYEFVVE